MRPAGVAVQWWHVTVGCSPLALVAHSSTHPAPLRSRIVVTGSTTRNLLVGSLFANRPLGAHVGVIALASSRGGAAMALPNLLVGSALFPCRSDAR